MPVALTNGPTGNLPGVDRHSTDHASRKPSVTAAVTESISPSNAHLDALMGLVSLSRTPGLPGNSAAPQIDGVQLDLSPEDMAAALLVLQGKTQEAQLRVAREGIQFNKIKVEQKNQQALAKIQDINNGVDDTLAKQKAANISGWIEKIFSLIAAVCALVLAALANAASAGAATPALALAACMVVGASLSVASMASQANGGPALDLSAVLPKLFTVVFEALGIPKEKAEDIGKALGGALAVVMPVVLVSDPAMLANAMGGITALAGGSAEQQTIVTGVFTVLTAIASTVALFGTGASSAAMLSELPTVLSSAVRVTQAALGGLSGITGATHAGFGVAIAIDQNNVDNLQSDNKRIAAQIAHLLAQMSDDREDIKKALDMMMDGASVVSQMIQEAGESHARIASNLGRPGTV